MHYVTNYVFFNVLHWNYLAAAVAYTLSRFYYFILQAAYIHWKGLGSKVWGTPSRRALDDWGRFAALAYPSAAMRCMESFCYSGMTVISGELQVLISQ
jgi:multidrug resistance protein, MATE family